ncbi:hypothetical protein [Sinomonas terrae]|uniref:Uncharacterized protein n=1 Tax=Sinomonas terrae TaxID=2908838 RepID=A0ABS9U720_9MICC|nr:hypothetical protein [Sinomonas terrae]MCH6472494.1 hypothetical protein [Sinomonas terrae]
MKGIPEPSHLVRAGFDEWAPEPGAFVELRSGGAIIRAGRIEAVMPDASGFWLGADGLDTRQYVGLSSDCPEIWIRSDSPVGSLDTSLGSSAGAV